jgi:hypothetical protein
LIGITSTTPQQIGRNPKLVKRMKRTIASEGLDLDGLEVGPARKGQGRRATDPKTDAKATPLHDLVSELQI